MGWKSKTTLTRKGTTQQEMTEPRRVVKSTPIQTSTRRDSPRSQSNPSIQPHIRTNSTTTTPYTRFSPSIKAHTNLNSPSTSTVKITTSPFSSNYSLNATTSSSSLSIYPTITAKATLPTSGNVSPTLNSSRPLAPKSNISSSSPTFNSQPTPSYNRPTFSSSSPRSLSPTRLPQSNTPGSPPKAPFSTSRLNTGTSSSPVPFSNASNTLRSPPPFLSARTAPPTVASSSTTRSVVNGGGPILRHARSQSVTSTNSSNSAASFFPSSSSFYSNGNVHNQDDGGNSSRMQRAPSSTQSQLSPSAQDPNRPFNGPIRANSSVGFTRNNSFMSGVSGGSGSGGGGSGKGVGMGLGIDMRANHAAEKERVEKERAEREKVEREEKERMQSEERENEAKIQRKIADLEITNSSLLSINSSLERLKLKHTLEIRDLKRRLRESRLHPPFLTPGLSSGSSASHTSDDEAPTDEDDDLEEEIELPWEELLKEDEGFGNLAGLVGEMLRKGKEAVAYKAVVEKGRVLNVVEMEEAEEGADTTEEEE